MIYEDMGCPVKGSSIEARWLEGLATRRTGCPVSSGIDVLMMWYSGGTCRILVLPLLMQVPGSSPLSLCCSLSLSLFGMVGALAG